ncbi:hypothetical protein ACQEU8_33410 [Streptomyces sp. CA-250714]|uniref:hypothetical protein n=1 Tax=Streptomyces sp. CA-250714 TaxID=3240060 RepID=UPI003D89FA74
MSDWTVIGLFDQDDATLHVAAVFPGDVTATPLTPSTDGLLPVLRVMTAPNATEAAAALQAHVEGAEPMPATSPCRSCRDRGRDEARFRNAFGHDKPGHRLSNLMKREGFGDPASLLAADLSALDGLRGMGAESRARVRLARRRLRSPSVG